MKVPEIRIPDCEKCIVAYHMPYHFCCLYECGEHGYCRNCKGGIYYEKGTIEARKEISPETEDRD